MTHPSLRKWCNGQTHSLRKVRLFVRASEGSRKLGLLELRFLGNGRHSGKFANTRVLVLNLPRFIYYEPNVSQGSVVAASRRSKVGGANGRDQDKYRYSWAR